MEMPRHWRLRKQRYSLIGEECSGGHKVFPPRAVCPGCSNEEQYPIQLNKNEETYLQTTVYAAPAGLD